LEIANTERSLHVMTSALTSTHSARCSSPCPSYAGRFDSIVIIAGAFVVSRNHQTSEDFEEFLEFRFGDNVSIATVEARIVLVARHVLPLEAEIGVDREEQLKQKSSAFVSGGSLEWICLSPVVRGT
jgi:hypothetical protein